MRQKLFLDTNVVIDLLGERASFYPAAAKIATLADKNEVELVVSALTYSTVYYVLAKFEPEKLVRQKIQKLKVIVETADLTDRIIEKGLSSTFTDFEDALQYYSANATNCTHLITRNGKDFKLSDIPVFTPQEFLNGLRNG